MESKSPPLSPQVGDGTTDFTPSPEESRQLISRSYRVTPTLLLRYADDGIDESPEMERILRSSMSSGALCCAQRVLFVT